MRLIGNLAWAFARPGAARQFGDPGGRGSFPAALGLSLAIHAITLAWLPPRHRPDPPPLPTLLAQLRPTAPLPAAIPAATADPAPAPERQRSPRPRPAHPAPEAGFAATSPAESSAPPAIGEAHPAAADAGASETAAIGGGRPPAADAGALEGYGRTLSELLARQRGYPRLAALRGWEGEVRLRLRVAAKGDLVGVEVLRSSGFETLDQHALHLVQESVPLPLPPAGLQEGEIQVVVPISYRLRKPT